MAGTAGSASVDIGASKRRFAMRHRLHFTALIAMSLLGAAGQALAQQGAATRAASDSSPGIVATSPVGAQNPRSAGISSGGPSTTTTTTGMGSGLGPGPNLNSGDIKQPGASSGGASGRVGAVPSGLDDPYYPGFPGRVGQ
jgi:hypothetical protein